MADVDSEFEQWFSRWRDERKMPSTVRSYLKEAFVAGWFTLRDLMKRRGLSQNDIAMRTGYTRRQVARWLKAGTMPWPAADRVACRLGFNTSELFPDFYNERRPA